MRSGNQHIIQKQTIEIEFENIDDSFGVQNLVAQVFYESLQPQIGILLDEMFGADQYSSIDKLEIDCGLLNMGNWEKEFAAQAVVRMKEELIQASRKKTDVKEFEESTAAETFFSFLENGFLPWNKRINTISELEQLIKVDEIKIRLKKLILQKMNAAKRLAFQFSDEFINDLITGFTDKRKHETEILSAIHEKIKTIQNGWLVTDQIQKQLIDETLLTVFASDEIENRELRFFTILLLKVENNDDLKSDIKEIIKKLRIRDNRSALKNEVDKLERVVESHEGELYKEENQEQQSNEVIYITNAGLVLLHPFLPTLFDNLKLTEENAWVNEDSMYKAVQAMEFMVSGKDETEEFDLILNKILCGTHIDEVVPTTIKLDKATKTECDDLLNAVIKHWEALKNTSIAGFRETFLLRKGILSKVDDGWLLQVEQKTFDILLSSLPWGIGIIKLPWMNEMLVVEWT